MVTHDDQRRAQKMLREALLSQATRTGAPAVLVDPKKVGQLKARYDALQDVLATAQYLAVKADETREFTIAGIPHTVDASTNVPELVELILAAHLKAEPAVWAAAKQKLAKSSELSNVEQAKNRLSSALKSAQLLFPDVSLTVKDAVTPEEDKAPVASDTPAIAEVEVAPEPAPPAEAVSVATGADTQAADSAVSLGNLPATSQEDASKSISLEEEAMHALNRSVMKTAVETIGPDLAKTIKKISYMPESIRLAIQRDDNAAIDQLATLMGLFAEHLGTIPEFNEELGQSSPNPKAVMLKTLHDVLGKISELRTVEAVRTNPASPPASVGKYPDALGTLSTRLQKLFPVIELEQTLSVPRTTRDVVDDVIRHAAHGEMSNLDVASELHAGLMNSRLLETPNFANWFPLDANHTQEDADVRMVLMHLCRAQVQTAALIRQHMSSSDEERDAACQKVLPQNKDVFLHHYLSNHYGEQKTDTPELSDEILHDKMLLRQWIINHARSYLDSGEANEMTAMPVVAFWQRYQQAKITEKNPYVPCQNSGRIITDIEEVFRPVVTGKTIKITPFPQDVLDRDPSVVMSPAPTGKVRSLEHREKGLKGGGVRPQLRHDNKPEVGLHTRTLILRDVNPFDPGQEV